MNGKEKKANDPIQNPQIHNPIQNPVHNPRKKIQYMMNANKDSLYDQLKNFIHPWLLRDGDY